MACVWSAPHVSSSESQGWLWSVAHRGGRPARRTQPEGGLCPAHSVCLLPAQDGLLQGRDLNPDTCIVLREFPDPGPFPDHPLSL